MTDSDSRVATVRYAGIAFAVEADAKVLEAVAAQTEPFFSWSEQAADAQALLRLRLVQSGLPEDLTPLVSGRPREIIVDCSLYEHLASAGARWDAREGYLIRIEKTGTFCWFSNLRREVHLYQLEFGPHVLDAVRLVKGLMTPAVERDGAIQIHASGVVVGDSAVLLVGDQKQGKTTLLLELLSKFDARQLTCDTTILRVTGERPTAYGWPSPFSVSQGTMADHKQLYDAFPAERRAVAYDTLWVEGKKCVLASYEVVQAFGTAIEPVASKLDALLFLRFSPEGPVGIRLLEDYPDLGRRLREVYLGSYDPIYPNWHQYLTCNDSEIARNINRCAETLACRVALYEFTWAASSESLLKRVPVLARGHKDLGHLLQF